MSSIVEAFGFFALGMVAGTFALLMTARHLIHSRLQACQMICRDLAYAWMERIGHRPEEKKMSPCYFCGWENLIDPKTEQKKFFASLKKKRRMSA